MSKPVTATPVAPLVDVLDVRLLDLFAELESLLRYGRHVQHDAIRMRGIRAALTEAQQRSVARQIRKAVGDIDREARALREIVSTVVEAATDLQAAVQNGNGRARRRPATSRRR